MAAQRNNLVAAVAKQVATQPTPEPTREPAPATAAATRPAPAAAPRVRRERYSEANRPHTIMLPVGLIARLDEAVRATGRSKADLARTAIDRYLQDLEL